MPSEISARSRPALYIYARNYFSRPAWTAAAGGWGRGGRLSIAKCRAYILEHPRSTSRRTRPLPPAYFKTCESARYATPPPPLVDEEPLLPISSRSRGYRSTIDRTTTLSGGGGRALAGCFLWRLINFANVSDHWPRSGFFYTRVIARATCRDVSLIARTN